TPRFEKVLVRGQLISGEQVEFWSEGLLAQVMQHEIDHLEGLTYIDRLEKEKRRAAMAALRQTSWF
ncbi:MAG: peptide deformylase, partial [Actinomycetota bacterium]